VLGRGLALLQASWTAKRARKKVERATRSRRSGGWMRKAPRHRMISARFRRSCWRLRRDVSACSAVSHTCG
jgi:hypothetical protein